MKPIIKYRGGKSKEIPHIIKYIPNYTGRYIEPFFGGGALFFHLEPQKAIINDINKRLVDFYKGSKNDYSTVKTQLSEIETIYFENIKAFDELKSHSPNERVADAN